MLGGGLNKNDDKPTLYRTIDKCIASNKDEPDPPLKNLAAPFILATDSLMEL